MDCILYKEIAPVSPLVASRLNPLDFYDLIVKNPTSLVTLPAIAFTELRLGELADDPEMGEVGDLPYTNMDHLRRRIESSEDQTRRNQDGRSGQLLSIAYRTVKNGFFVGNGQKLLYYPMPEKETLRER